MELVAGAMGSLLPKLGELLKEEYGLQKGVREKIKSLSRELQVVHAVLRKIGDVPSEQLDELVSLWVHDVREASYDMEDIVDTFLVSVDDHEPIDPNMLRRLRKKMGGLFKKIKARRKISNLIQDISKKLEEVAARRSRYTLDSIIVAKPVAANTIDPRILNLYKRATELVGIDGPRDELINMLSFGANVDVPVGQNPDVKKVFRDILIGLDKDKYTNSDLMVLDEKQLMDELNEFVEEKRYFIVIDDIWNKTTWNLIRGALQDSNCGSRVVVTTRISEVATHAGEAYKMQPLSCDNSEKLLYARLADGEGKYFDSPSAEACENFLKKCGGVPLAIITIASLLASKPGVDWSEVYNSIGFGHGGNDDVHNTRKILSFSYYDLPSHLKACLLYLSIFLEDQVIEKNSLIRMWIAEGFINEEQAGIELYELGERCFNELINRSMIQPVETDDEGHVYGCHVHDMVFDLIRSLSSQENFVTVLDGDERQKLPGTIARRLALQHIKEHNGGELANIAVGKLRSFIASQCNLGSSYPRIIPVFLRVLQMVYCREGTMLDYLGSLLHLRYLQLSYMGINELPKEVRYLRFLQTLDLRNCADIKELPDDVGLLTQLVCLRLAWDTRVPVGLIGKLTALQELWMGPAAAAADDDDDDVAAVTMQFVKELGKLRELRILDTYIDVKSESTERTLLESLGNLHNIRSLDIGGSSVDNGRETRLAGLFSCRHVQYLRFKCFMFSELTSCIELSLAPNLSYLEVEVLVVKEQDMDALARLPELCCLKLHSHDETKLASIKICTEGAAYFRKLRILQIFGSTIWFDLYAGGRCNTSSAAYAIMPSLESLEFQVGVRLLKDEALLLSFDMLLGFEKLGRTSLQKVTAYVHCGGARTAAVHPKPLALQMIRLAQDDILSDNHEGKANPPRGNKHCTKCGSDYHVAKDCRVPKRLILRYQRTLKEAKSSAQKKK
ncbi:unnamed protein product [Urochloa decumbens]|uniref:CCHC-type domain-containing protein n=1 Tax=Urochloa decumbens TaxID=240449 RepID=A0ABC9GWH3_9POAL